MFWNTEISHGVRTEGLDMFTPESFRDKYLGVKQRLSFGLIFEPYARGGSL